MNILIIGSMALKYNMMIKGMDHSMIKPKDVDVIAFNQDAAVKYINDLYEEIPHLEHIDLIKQPKFKTVVDIYYDRDTDIHYEITYPVEECTTSRLFTDEFNHHKCGMVMYADIPTLYALKMSHRYLRNSPAFLKTMHHIKIMRKLFPEDLFYGNVHYNVSETWLTDREKETYDYSSYSLKKASKDFFTSNFEYVYDHDSIHEAVKHLDTPAYQKYVTEGEEVHCSSDKFFHECSKAVRYFGVLEECYVLALERSQIPSNFTEDPKNSFMMALEKVCTSITSGWFREFAWEHYEIVVQLYNEDYVQKFKDALESNVIKPYGGVK